MPYALFFGRAPSCEVINNFACFYRLGSVSSANESPLHAGFDSRFSPKTVQSLIFYITSKSPRLFYSISTSFFPIPPHFRPISVPCRCASRGGNEFWLPPCVLQMDDGVWLRPMACVPLLWPLKALGCLLCALVAALALGGVVAPLGPQAWCPLWLPRSLMLLTVRLLAS